MGDMNPEDYADLIPDKSAGELVKALRRVYEDWHAKLPQDARIAFYVPLVGGGLLSVGYVAAMDYNNLYIQGRDSNGETYVLIAHQATVQFLCKVKKVTPDEPRRPIGFGPHHPAPPKPEE